MDENLRVLFGVWLFLMGLAVGSFLNVVICRLPKEQSLGGRSRCPRCGKELLSRDLVPIVSQLLLRSRCRFCGEKFSWRYLVVELLTGLIFVGLYAYLGLDRLPELVTFLVTFAALFALFIIDWETTLIPYELWLVILIAGVGHDVYGLATGTREMTRVFSYATATGEGVFCLPQSVAGIIVGGLGLRLFVFLADLAFRKETMGFGDIYLTAAAGAHFGPGLALILYIVIAAFLGAAIGGAQMALSRGKRTDTVIPFGPFLAVAMALLLLAGDRIVPAVRGFLFP